MVAVSATSPTNAATAVALNSGLSATFNQAMNPVSITAASFTLLCGTTPVVGTVSASGVTATFLPAQPLSANSSYTATIAASVESLAGNAMASSYSWTFTAGSSANVTAPTVTSTSPATGATAVPTNSSLTATFSEAMAPATLGATTFLLSAPGALAIPGSVTYAGMTAVFQPTAALASNTLFTATITIAASDLSGNAIAANYVWTFTTGIAPDTTPPTVLSTIPIPDATAVSATAALSATFSKSISPATINSATFTLSGPGGVAVPGTVSFDAASSVATFQASASLSANSGYVATIHGAAGGVSDISGNLLVSDHAWSFTTGGRTPLTPVLLGSSANYAVLAKTAISTVPASKITGDIALSPAAATFVTGFSLVADSTNRFSTSPQVVGKIYAADYAVPTPMTLTTAISDMLTGYTDAAGRPTPDFLNLKTGNIGGLTLTPGLYKWTSTVTIPSDVTLVGSATDVWIFQVSGDLTMSAAKNVILSGGAISKNVFWQVAGTVSIGTNAHVEGIILSQTAITLQTGASMNGRALAQTQVALQVATVTSPAP